MKKTILLFIHGLGGHPQKTWGKFPQLIEQDSDLADLVDCRFYSFPTKLWSVPLLSSSPKIQALAAGLASEITYRYSNYQRVVLVAHSLGGLVARQYLVDIAMAQKSHHVAGLLLYAVPNNGAGLASVAKYLSWWQPQLKQLCKESDFIDTLNTQWTQLKLGELIPAKFIVGGTDAVVSKFSAESYWGNDNVITVIDKGHVDLVKPDNPDDLTFLILKDFVTDSLVDQVDGSGTSETKEALNVVDSISRPSPIRSLLDFFAPRFHSKLIKIGFFEVPKERAAIIKHITHLGAKLEQDFNTNISTDVTNYIPLRAKEVPEEDGYKDKGKCKNEQLLTPSQQHIRVVQGEVQGGDSATSRTAMLSRKSKIVKDILSCVENSSVPLVLLGDPGSGKSMTIKQAAWNLIEREKCKQYPCVCLIIRLGEFYIDGIPDADSVENLVRGELAKSGIQCPISKLEERNRLIVFFDGMDEMSRRRYNEHTKALSIYAGSRRERVKTLFSCRITDFSPQFIHQRLVLLPFGEKQISLYLRHQIFKDGKIIKKYFEIEGEKWTSKRMIEFLLRLDSTIEGTNPFGLWLLVIFLHGNKRWPLNRIEMLRFYIQNNYHRKLHKALWGKLDGDLAAWAAIAYLITKRNQGMAVPLQEVIIQCIECSVEAIDRAISCGIIISTKSRDVNKWPEEPELIRFEHHRFQEYFTAYHIIHNSVELDWEQVFFIPRWQESLVNLMIMGGNNNSLRKLTGALQRWLKVVNNELFVYLENLETQNDLTYKKNKSLESDWNCNLEDILDEECFIQPHKSALEHESEHKLADLVELSARLLKRVSIDNRSRKRLRKTFLEGVRFLVFFGDPISQIRALRAASTVQDIDIYPLIIRRRSENMEWIRIQVMELLTLQDIRKGC